MAAAHLWMCDKLNLPPIALTQEERYEFVNKKLPGILFIPSLKALCLATLANASRVKQVSRVDPHLYELYNRKVKTCELPGVAYGRTPHWTSNPTMLVKKRKRPATRNGPDYVLRRQCVSCWIRDPEPLFACSWKLQTVAEMQSDVH